MNSKGFTLIELLATLVVLGIIFGISIVGLNFDFGSAKDKTEEIFVETIEDAMDMYLDSTQAKSLSISSTVGCISKSHGRVNLYKIGNNITMQNVIDSDFKPLEQSDLVNPANEVKCANASDIVINVYKDDDFIYYYEIDKSEFGCLTEVTDDKITNLPSYTSESGC